MVLFAERGFAGASVRDIANAAGVSSSLVVHHFGSKAGLQEAIEARVVALFTEVLGQAAAAAGGEITPAALAQMFPGELHVVRYLRRMLIEGGDTAKALFGQLLDATEATLSALVEQGVVRPSPDPRWRAAFLLVNDFAVLLLDDLITATLGESPLGEEGLRRWTEVLMRTYTEGVFVTPPDDRPSSGEE